IAREPGSGDHKYTRGYVAVLAGEMPGASALTAVAALRAGAGYVRLIGQHVAGMPHAVVQGPGDPEALLADARIGAVALGPGFGRGADAARLLDMAIASGRPLVLDADALIAGRIPAGAILTPHEGEFARLFPALTGSKVEKARAAAAQSGAVIVYKGPDTVVAAPGGRAAIAPPAPHWLASAGTGDVLTGVIAAQRAAGLQPFEAACAGVWLHGRAAERAGPGLIADDLIAHL
ncbi:MAG: ADP-dependent NAD(P)H-hydrate dehydratase / NAD(P)H-hydrate epimerase, partial [Sphingomonadales bacterium]|nr:ADP-dependent NAD(P)H-hydrate dehydratase / NAD(P)H-hydrate epimerase [Sphingomonadales bacterium]